MHITVIGGGLVGVTTAWYLLDGGHTVTLVDRAPELAAEASHANGAMLHASHTEPWNTPQALGQLLRWIGRENSPLLLRPTALPSLVGWGLGFLRYSRPHHHARNTAVNARLAVYSLELMRELEDRLPLEYTQRHAGILKIFRSEAEMQTAHAGSALMAESGVRHEALTPAAISHREPALADIEGDLAGGFFYPDDASGDARLFCQRLGEAAVDRGLTLRLGESVQHLRVEGGRLQAIDTDRGTIEADAFVLATGAEAPHLARQAGVRLPIRPVKGYSATLPVGGLEAAPVLPIIDDGRKIVITRLGDQLRIAGTAEFTGYDKTIRPQRVRTVLEQGLANFPALAEQVDAGSAEQWACLRPMTVDGPPILGQSGVGGLYLNTGAGHLGWTFAAGAGRVVADMIDGRTPAIDLAGLTLDRYR
ncbi:D-amino acid dehydrogenase [Spiribacter vilamensis]|uniref:D-amino-acid dehydrogenase n=1 Tax=Spiribacter vilamensis TaxID=531306 RepID=A0A4Q8D1U7_9GAMM|nr:D-amino acid dehydrogenase [Spiribacter vilamensis]RZU99303.1 D-amino-acid dehydrogenase [Spiribacter vilamensis]TVO61713.1 FAD-dependent oxidoreductase [Spiribacter vilamensis]